ncbi:MAG: ABC transporter substrate-binding protein [Patescibacteria group bacterium]
MKNFIQKISQSLAFFSNKIRKLAAQAAVWLKLSFKKQTIPLHERLDERLVLGLSSKKGFPTWQQLKFLGKFLKPGEKKTITLLFLVIVAGLISLGAELVLKHYVSLPAPGGEYIEGVVGAPQTINPLFSLLNTADADLSRLIYAGLFKYDEAMKLVPDLAESYTISQDGRTISIKLKKDLTWQDSEPLTAEDVGFTISRIQDPETQSPLWVSFQGVAFEQTDELNFSLILPEAFSPFLNLLTVGILPEHQWQEISPANMKLSSLNLKPTGAGPFMFSAFSKDNRGNIKSYTLKTNPSYHLGQPYIKNITFRFFNDFESGLEALRNRQIHALNFLPKDQKDKINRKGVKVYPLRLPYYTAAFFNQKKNLLLKSLPLRQALAYSLDRNQIVANALKGEGMVINGPILPGQVGFTQDFKLKYDPIQAQQLLDKDGWNKISREDFIAKRKQELYQAWLDARKAKTVTVAAGQKAPKPTAEEIAAQNKAAQEFLTQTAEQLTNEINSRQNVFRHKNNFGLTIKITTLNQPEFLQTAALIKDTWQDLGIQVNLELLELNQLKEAIKNRNYEVLIYGVLLGTDSDPFPFWHSSQTTSPGLNLAGFINRTADDQLEKARANFSLTERTKLYYNFQKILAADLPAIFLYTTTYLYPMDMSVQGFHQYRIYQPADRFAGISKWYLRTQGGWK